VRSSPESITNGCELKAAIGADNDSIELHGPYYASGAPMCCPTKPHASAVLRYHHGKWLESPAISRLHPEDAELRSRLWRVRRRIEPDRDYAACLERIDDTVIP